MMRSMFSGVSSIRNHQIRMDVIGNNIANVNTVGYKADRVNFQEVFHQTIRGASAPSGNRGGVNPMQVGLGVTVGSIDTLHTEASLEMTGLMTDLAIEGNGFFIVNDGDRSFYTRAGLFDIDAEGNMYMRGNGLYVQGWTTVPGSGEPGRINLHSQMSVEPRASENFWLGGNLNASEGNGSADDPNVTLVGLVRDSQGGAHQVEVRFWKTDDNEWSWDVIPEDRTTAVSTGTLTFDATGRITGEASQAVTWTPPGGVEPMTVTFDFSQMTQYAQQTSAEVIGHDGLVAGSLETYTIDAAGVIRGVYSNGLTRDLGQVAIAHFANPGGLMKVGDTMFDVSANSGEAQIGRAGEGGRGTIAPGSLEMSNVDLSLEFTNMITTQRGFQASSRVITTSDEMLQELVNLKR